jgi:two-component system, NarL family, sensor histidine kinase UhpB
MTLRHRLIALIALVLPLSLLVGGLLTYWHAVRKVETEMAAALAFGESSVRDAIVSMASSADPTLYLARVVASFTGERHLQVSHIGPDGKIAAQSQVSRPKGPPPEWLARVLAGPQHSISVELPGDLKKFGQLQIAADPLNEVTEVWDDVTLKLTIIAGFFGLVLGLVYWALGRALRPLEDLSKALAEVGHGNFAAHVSENGPQELSAIYKEFNRMADQLQAAELQNRRLNAQLSTVQEEERADIARDLHDEIGPFLFAVDVDAQTIPTYLQRGAVQDATLRASAIRQSVAHMQSHIRSILGRLRPSVLLDLGLSHAIDQLVAFWRKRHPGITFNVVAEQTSYGAKIDEVAYRIVQEAVSNAVRHGNPSEIGIAIKADDGGMLRVSVSNNGRELMDNGSHGFGLAGMRERIAAQGGTLSISNAATGHGVELNAALPLPIFKVTPSDKIENRARMI